MDKKSAGQHLDQHNLCYRSDDCKQANQGQQIVEKNNDAKGFNDQSAIEPVDIQGNDTRWTRMPSGFTFNESTKKCEKPACTADLHSMPALNNAKDQQQYRQHAQTALPPPVKTCPGTTTNVPAICPANYAGPSSTGIAQDPSQERIGGTCPAPIGATTVIQGPYINNQGQCEIVNWRRCNCKQLP